MKNPLRRRVRKLSDKDVEEIRLRFFGPEEHSVAALARDFSVSGETVRDVVLYQEAYERDSEPSLEEYLVDFFWARVEKGPECWEWRGARLSNGYGQIKTSLGVESVNIYAHRFSYELHNGPLAHDECALHHCDNPPCVRPIHLFAGTKADNTADMMAKGRHVAPNRGVTHCKWGHEFTPENTHIDKLGKRVCRTCARLSQRRYRAAKRGAK